MGTKKINGAIWRHELENNRVAVWGPNPGDWARYEFDDCAKSAAGPYAILRRAPVFTRRRYRRSKTESFNCGRDTRNALQRRSVSRSRR